MKREKFDIFTENFISKGTAYRDEVHQNGEWHQTFHCHIVTRDHDGDFILFQKRHPNKDIYPNCYDIAVAGHLTVGESAEDGVREIEEEVGIKVSFQELHPIGIIREEILSESFIDREFSHVYFLEWQGPIEELSLQKEEVTGMIKLKLEDAEELFADRINAVQAEGFAILDEGIKERVMPSVTKSDFAYHVPVYYKTVLSAIRSFLDSQS